MDTYVHDCKEQGGGKEGRGREVILAEMDFEPGSSGPKIWLSLICGGVSRPRAYRPHFIASWHRRPWCLPPTRCSPFTSNVSAPGLPSASLHGPILRAPRCRLCRTQTNGASSFPMSRSPDEIASSSRVPKQHAQSLSPYSRALPPAVVRERWLLRHFQVRATFCRPL